MTARVLGIDYGLATCGLALVELHDDGDRLIDLDVVRTSKSAKKLKVMVAEDTARRAREVYAEIWAMANRGEVVGIAVERFSSPRNSTAAGKMAVSYGLVIAITEFLRVPMISVSPQECKKALCGDRGASKAAVERAVVARFPEDFDVVARFEDRVTESAREHAFDAAGVAIVAMTSEMGRVLRGRVAA